MIADEMEHFKHKILVIDDDDGIIFALRQLFTKDGYEVVTAQNASSGLQLIPFERPSLVFMDINMPGMNGLDTLKRMKEEYPDLPVIMITGFGTVETAVRAMQFGAFDYLTKPLDIRQLRKVVSEALVNIDNGSFSRYSAEPIKAELTDNYELVGKSAQMQKIYKLIGSISTTPNSTPVLLLGESGTGKELVARAIHSYGPNKDEPFVAVNCTAVPETLLESELFGYEKGAFTGAGERKQGKFEIAGSGTIFLDEIGDLPVFLQQKLLRVLQERQFERLGGNEPVYVAARVIAATNRDISEEVNKGTFRKDLFYRLNVMVIHLPLLRERREDVPVLANYFLLKYSKRMRKKISGFSDDAMKMLNAYDYPGNVRELENIIERAVILSKLEVITPDLLRDVSFYYDDGHKLPVVWKFAEARKNAIDKFEIAFVKDALKRNRGNITAAARESGMTRQNFQRLVSKHRINVEEFR
ncbi:MAG: sigma-54-dependent transcriptional regulator [Candidatus Kryptoniota bacterium]